MLSRTKPLGALVGAGALLIGLAAGGGAQAAPAAQSKTAQSKTAQSKTAQSTQATTLKASQLPAWYHTPLTAAQVKSEVAVPASPWKLKGKVRLTKAAYTTDGGSLAVPASLAAGHVLIAGESIQLAGAGVFGVGSGKLTAVGRADVADLRSALKYVSEIKCEGYTDYAATGAAADAKLSQARAAAVCRAVARELPAANFAAFWRGYGEARPAVVGGTTHAQRAANRRVVVEIVSSSVGAPRVPTASVARAVNTSAVLDLVPAAGRLAVTGYQYSLDAGRTWATLPTTGTSSITGTISGLTAGTTYRVVVRDMTAAGYSLPTAELTVTPTAAVVPDAPVITTGHWVYGTDDDYYEVTLDWTEASPGSSPVTAWQWSGNDSAYTTLTGVTEASGVYTATFDAGPWVCGGEEDAFTLQAVNATGTSPASAAYSIDLGESQNLTPRHPDC